VKDGLIAILKRLPKGFYRRLMTVAKETSRTPEKVLDRGLRDEEFLAGLLEDPELERRIVANRHAKIGAAVAKNLGKDGRFLRARRGAYGKYASAANMDLDKYLEMRAGEAKMTVDEFLAQPKRKASPQPPKNPS
jgi:hypothetical protein